MFPMGACDLAEFTDKLRAGLDLSVEEATAAAGALADSVGSMEERQAFLLALHEKGETAQEVAAFAVTFRQRARDPVLGEQATRAFDFAGTGGDKSGTANISTMASLLVASCGVPVVKHGNRSITSKCGSADLVADLGFPLDADNATLRACLEATNFTFLFAPHFHPAFAQIMPVRKALAAEGKHTVFNILGPLLNPARTPYQVMGVFARHWVEPLAAVFAEIGVKRALVAHGEPEPGGALDELSCAGVNHVAGGGELAGLQETWPPGRFGLQTCTLDDLKGGDVNRNREILDELAAGKATQGLTETILLNAGVALWVAGQTETAEAGVDAARQQLGSGAFRDWLEHFKAHLA